MEKKKETLSIIIVTLFIIAMSMCIVNKKAYGFTVDKIKGSDRYETAAMISSKMIYEDAILINGTSIADGLSASGLSGTIHGPILLTEKNNIPDVTLSRLNNVKNVYIVGGQSVISDEIKSKLENKGIKVVRLAGWDRVATSIAVANEIEKIKGISNIFYVNGVTGQPDAMSVAPVAAKTGNPVILTDGKNTTFKRNCESFVIGGNTSMNSVFDSYGKRLGGVDRFDTNEKVINFFFKDKSEVYLSKAYELIDALTVSSLKKPVVLVSSQSKKEILAGYKKIIAIGGIDRDTLSKAEAFTYSDKVVFYMQHQDDETLFAGSAIIDAIKAVGKKNVYLVLLTKGDKTSIFNSERYKNLTSAERAELRNNEFASAIEKLGVEKNNVIHLNYDEYNVDYDAVSKLILYFEDKNKSVTHVTHSYKYDDHSEHLAIGELVNKLHDEGKIRECRFFLKPHYVKDVPSDYLIKAVSDDESENKAIIDACNEYKTNHNDMVREGIGYKSVPFYFDALINDPKCTAYLHKPGI